MDNQSAPFALWLKLVTAFFSAVGVPAVVWTLFQSTWTQHPLLALGLLIGYEVALLVISYFTLVFHNLRDLWAEESAKHMNHLVHRLLAGYERRYRRWLIYQHRDFDVKGLSTQGTYTLDLQQVFVDLRIDPTTIHQATSNPLHPSVSPSDNRRGIWDYLRDERLQNQQLAIIGSPGSGKTSLLKHIALTFALHQPTGIRQRMVFMLFLREVNHLLDTQPNYTLVEAIEANLQKHCPAPTDWVGQQLGKGRSLVLLDGLDEVADANHRQRVAVWVDQQMRDYGGNRFILTSRPFGYRSNPLSGVAVLEVHPFNSEQIERFLANWYLATERLSSQRDDPGVHAKAADGAQDLLQRLNTTPSLFALAVNPLLLTMIATVHRYRSSLPGKRVNLYEEICEVTLGKRQEARGVTLEIDARQKKQVLQPLAWTMMTRNADDQREISIPDACKAITATLQMVAPQLTPQQFLKIIEESSGLLLEHEQGSYSFAHLTFQEYLASTYAKEEGLETELALHVDESWWHETIRLYCAQTDATTIVSACLASHPPTVVALTLAADCLEEALKLAPAARSEVESVLTKWIDDPDPIHEDRRRLGAEVLLMRRLKNMPLWGKKIYRDTSLVTVAEYQLFRPDAVPLGPHQGSRPMLGVSDQEALAFCRWLNGRESGKGSYRLPFPDEIPNRDEEDKLMGNQTESFGYWTAQIKHSMNKAEPPFYFTLHWLKGPSEGEVLILENSSMLISASVYLCIVLFLITDYFTDDEGNDITIQLTKARRVRSQLAAFSQILAKFDAQSIQYSRFAIDNSKDTQTVPTYDYLLNTAEILAQAYPLVQELLEQTCKQLSHFLHSPIQVLYSEVSKHLSLLKVKELLYGFIGRYGVELFFLLDLTLEHEMAAVLEQELANIKECRLLLIEPSLLVQPPADLGEMLVAARIEHMYTSPSDDKPRNKAARQHRKKFSRFDVLDGTSTTVPIEWYRYALNRLLRDRRLLTPCEGILLVCEASDKRV